MGLKNMSILWGATITPSAGTAMVFADDGTTVQNGVRLVVPATADYRVRESATFKYKAPTVDPKLALYSRDSKEVVITIPMVTASGRIEFNTLRITRQVHPEYSAANCTNLNKLACQILAGDTDTDNFWAAGSMT